jgi:hypothetical protein
MKSIENKSLKFLKKEEQTEEICLEAVKQDGKALQYVKKQTEEICLEAVKQNGRALQYVKKQTEEICLEAVKQNGRALQFVKEQTEQMCLEAVKQNINALDFVEKQTEEICLEINNRKRNIIDKETDELVEDITKNIDIIDENLIIIYGVVNQERIQFKHIYIEYFQCDTMYNNSDKSDIYVSEKDHGEYPHLIGTICVDPGCEMENFLYILYLDREYDEDELYYGCDWDEDDEELCEYFDENEMHRNFQNKMYLNKYFIVRMLKNAPKFNKMLTDMKENEYEDDNDNYEEEFIKKTSLARILCWNDDYLPICVSLGKDFEL